MTTATEIGVRKAEADHDELYLREMIMEFSELFAPDDRRGRADFDARFMMIIDRIHRTAARQHMDLIERLAMQQMPSYSMPNSR